MDNIIDDNGKWLIQSGARMLIEPSESYLAQKELERQQKQEDEENKPLTEIELLQQQLAEQQNLIDTIFGGK